MAVYTEVSDDELACFIASYDVGELLSYKGIAEGVENSNYLVHTSAGAYILTLYERRVARHDLPFFLGLMEHLARRGISCPTPLRDRNGVNLRQLAGRDAVLVTFLEGFCIRRPRVEHCFAVGQALARLHLAGKDFSIVRPNALGLAGWRPLYEHFKDQADTIAPGLSDLVGTELTWLEDHWPKQLPVGIIHADLFPDNVFFLHDGISGLIDFYFACNDAFAYDIAVALNAWCFDGDAELDPEKGRALLTGYDDVRPLVDREREAMPILARGAALRFLLTRAYDWLNTPRNAIVKPHDPLDFERRLRVHQRVTSIASYGWGPRQ